MIFHVSQFLDELKRPYVNYFACSVERTRDKAVEHLHLSDVTLLLSLHSDLDTVAAGHRQVVTLALKRVSSFKLT